MQPEDEKKSAIEKALDIVMWVIIIMVAITCIVIVGFTFSVYYVSDNRGEQKRLNRLAVLNRQPTVEY